MDERIYTSGSDYRMIEKHPWEASPYGNVHKYNHDVYPAAAALGAKGCTDCHHPSSDFFFASVVKYPFDAQGQSVMEPQYSVLGLSGFWTTAGAWRETYLKPVVYILLIVLACALLVLSSRYLLEWGLGAAAGRLWFLPWLVGVGAGAGVLLLAVRPGWMAFVFPTRFWLDSNHPAIGGLVFFAGAVALLGEIRAWRTRQRGFGRTLRSSVAVELVISRGLASAAGALMMLKIPGLDVVTRASYTVFDVALALVLVGTVIAILCQAAGPKKL
jgi:hypothetical protein